MDYDHPDPERRWRNRRLMAWISLLAGLAYALLSGTDWISTDIAMPFYTFIGAVVGLYVGFATYETVKLK